MPQPHQIIRVGSDTDHQCHPHQSAPNQTSQQLSDSSDTSVPFLNLYLRAAEDHDQRKLNLLKGDTDQILVFCGLFSATVAALIIPSISDRNPGSSSGSLIDLANSCLLGSLLVSVSCALVALSLSRLTRSRIGVTAPRHNLSEQVRFHMLFDKRSSLSFVIETLDYFVHAAFSLFLVGLLVYIFEININAFYTAAFWIGTFVILYAGWTIMPLIRPGSLYSTPFSTILLMPFVDLLYGPSLVQERARKLAPRLDGDVLERTLNMLRSDDDLEQFFDSIPGFCVSEIVGNPRRSLNILGQQRLAEALVEFWNRTLSSNWVSESVKRRRLTVCIKVIEAADLSIAVPRILHLFSRDLSGVTRSVETAHSLAILRNGKGASLARGIISSVIFINDKRDESWSTLAMEEMGISEDVLRRYLAHGDSVLLANLIHITRQFFDSLDLDLTRKTLSILPSVSKFDILNALPELQHEFCSLWNEIVQQARNSEADNNSLIDILVEIRGLYVALHGADAAVGYFFASITSDDDNVFRRPASYPLCTMPDHECNSTTHIQETGGSTTGGGSHSTPTSPTPFSESSSLGNVVDEPLHVPTPEPSSHSAPSGRRDLPIDPPHSATSTVQGIADTSFTSSMARPIALSPSVAGDALRPNEIIGLESPPSVSTNALSHPKAAKIADPNIAGRTRTFSSATLRENGNAQDTDPAIQTELTYPPGELDPSVIVANHLRPQDRDSSDVRKV